MFEGEKQAIGSCSYLRVSNIRFCSFTTFFVLEMEAVINYPEYVRDQIATHCPIISRNAITKRANSLEEIWTMVWQHYNLQPPSFDKTNRGKQPNRSYNFSTHSTKFIHRNTQNCQLTQQASIHNKQYRNSIWLCNTQYRNNTWSQHTIQKQHPDCK